MKRSIIILSLFATVYGCSKIPDGDLDFLKTQAAPSSNTLLFDVSNDNSGKVTITPNSAGASSYVINFGDGSTETATVLPGKNVTHVYKEGVYPVKVTAKSMNGLTSDTTAQLTVTFRAPENVVINASTDAHKATVSATADYATGGFKVSFGESANEEPTLIAAGASLEHTYAKAGNYTIKVEALSGGAATTVATKDITIYDPITLPMTFELATVNYAWGDFGGNSTSVIPNPYKTGINTSATVGKIVKNGQETWAGNYIIMSAPIDFTQHKVFKVKVYSWRAGMRVLLQLERNGDNTFQENMEAVTTKANQWETLTFDFSGKIKDNSKLLQNILFFLDNGVRGNSTDQFTLLFDDIELTN
ncbi:PKD domain-containing protein [Chitinophaga terrae (ex Kim and Jung 2007)]|uniref:PKD domain-containing protein n=1 Tax=Chitinophaga terrae (ex Kim and Jung 2007) TaxID=408074 RepID=A0A1H4GG09_9BACT|nr:PKD domain-containing protein [Chitinophaga terrae (ex Kim and Jung 2007)]MDQ0110070.1 hypothetical protein [Chitinophaga terrae (ex Kim and Jung 2007)]GEP93426.1 hypothetical protein CTE07_50710 [Chitinophaga terrae (ex Kim and Jung 2007)]SEB08536.1 PKD domain-containing protein [Chitinophaga terrae (ex Kim and Jung 2007)]